MSDPVIGAAQFPAVQSPRLPQKTKDPEAIGKVAKEFEAVFLAQMLQPMFAEMTASAPFGGGLAEDMWRSMQVEQFGKAIAEQGGIGLADAVAKEMLALQEKAEGQKP
ncbi:MAG: rod-binding protein [Hyphomicrobiales bacterium]|nr:rod-binding protein [Hyphomicrobiales bacterium]